MPILETLKIASLSPKTIAAEFIDLDPIGRAEQEGNPELAIRYVQEAAQQQEGFCALFNEMPDFPTKLHGDHLLKTAGYRKIQKHANQTFWQNTGVLAVQKDCKNKQFPITFHFQNHYQESAVIFSGGNTSPFTCKNGDTFMRHSFTSQPGMMAFLKTASSLFCPLWRVPMVSKLDVPAAIFSQVTEHVYPFVEPSIKEWNACTKKEEILNLPDSMAASGEVFSKEGEFLVTGHHGNKRYWTSYRGKFQSFNPAAGPLDQWVAAFRKLVDHATDQGFYLNERNTAELQISGKLCCTNGHSHKVLFQNKMPVIVNYSVQFPDSNIVDFI